jgi:hypothetical protein
MKQNYDVFNGGMADLLKDIEAFKIGLIEANNEISQEVSSIIRNNIISNASQASEEAQRTDIASLTNVMPITQGEEASSIVFNTSVKATFAEFGYGIIGKGSPYMGNQVFDMQKAGWQGYDLDSKGYDLDSKRKFEDRSWFYRDRNGQLLRSSGAIPTHIWFNSVQLVMNNVDKIVSAILERKLNKK